MANISVTYTFSNGTVADATAVNQNFTDIVNGTSDGTKDMSIAALTVAGSATLNGAVTLGNASGDDLTFTGLAASDFKPKTDATYNLGSTTLGWLGLYLGKNSNRLLLKNNDSASASWTYTFPVNAGVAGQIPVNQGSGTMAWKYACVESSAKSADYPITDTDMIRTVLMTTGASDRVVTLPTLADNLHRIITVKKVDADTGACTLKGEAVGETIDGTAGTTGIALYNIGDHITVQASATEWVILSICQTEYAASTTGTWDAAAAAGNTVYGVDGAPISGALGANRNKVVRFKTGLTDYDVLDFEFKMNGTEDRWMPACYFVGGTYLAQGSTEYGSRLADFNTSGTDVTVTFFRYPSSSNATYAGTGSSWSSASWIAWRFVKRRVK